MTKGYYAILFQTFGMKVGTRRKTKAEAENDAKKWREHIKGLKRKPEGKVCVITAEKLEAMAWSCAVTPWTTQAEDAAIVAARVKAN